MEALTEAISILGGQANLAERLRVSPQAVNQWLKERRPIPGGRVIEICRATNGAVRPYDLRPDIYPDPDWLPPDVISKHAESA